MVRPGVHHPLHHVPPVPLLPPARDVGDPGLGGTRPPTSVSAASYVSTDAQVMDPAPFVTWKMERMPAPTRLSRKMRALLRNSAFCCVTLYHRANIRALRIFQYLHGSTAHEPLSRSVIGVGCDP
jgi:hypothetical protein